MDYIGKNTSYTTEKGLGKPFHQIVIGFVLFFFAHVSNMQIGLLTLHNTKM